MFSNQTKSTPLLLLPLEGHIGELLPLHPPDERATYHYLMPSNPFWELYSERAPAMIPKAHEFASIVRRLGAFRPADEMSESEQRDVWDAAQT